MSPPPATDERAAYTIKEAADLLRISTSHLYALIKRGEVRRVKLGRRSLIPASEIERQLHPGIGETQ